MWMISNSASGSALKAVSVAFVPSKSLFSPNSYFYPLDNPRTYAYNKGWLQSAVVRSGRTRLQLPRSKARPDNFQCNLSLGVGSAGLKAPPFPGPALQFQMANGRFQMILVARPKGHVQRPRKDGGVGDKPNRLNIFFINNIG